jgi:hypothetical protein
VPWLQQPHHEHTFEQIEITAAGGLIHPERAAQFGAVPKLAVKMGEHGPEALQGGCRHAHPQFGDVAFQQGADEVASPDQAGFLGIRQKGAGKTTAQPQACGGFLPHLHQRKTRHLHNLEAASQRFR